MSEFFGLHTLESVGAVITNRGWTYAELDGGYDTENGWHISQIENVEWWSALSKADRQIVESVRSSPAYQRTEVS